MKENKDKEQNSEMEDVQFEDQHTETKIKIPAIMLT